MRKWFNSFRHALNGIILFFQTERNGKIELAAACIAIFLSLWLQISEIEFCIILLCIGVVLAAEAFNSTIERLTDLVKPNIDPSVKALKDIAAGAVLILSLISLIIGITILGPRLALEFGIL